MQKLNLSFVLIIISFILIGCEKQKTEKTEAKRIVNASVVFVDTKNDLMWQRGEPGEKSLQDAQRYCDTLTLEGFSDWKLPTTNELLSICSTSESKNEQTFPQLPTQFFGDSSYWSSDSRKRLFGKKQQCVSFRGSDSAPCDDINCSDEKLTRCVREGK
jgi:hypothetical protein